MTDEELPLHAAAAIAYRRVFGTRRERVPSNDELDLVALALSLYLPIHGEHGRISEEELMEGMFFGGAARFESRHRPGGTARLTVVRRDLERVLRALQRESGTSLR